MKKNLIIVLLLMMASFSYAQTFQIGAKAGINISNYTGDMGDVSKSALIGFHAGGMFNFKLGDNFSIQPEALFSSQGAKIKLADGEKRDFKVSYINVPVMAKFRTDGGFYVEAGPQVGFKIDESTGDNTINSFAKNLDLSGAVGLGYHSSTGLGVGARYIAGFSKVGDFDGSDVKPDFKNSVIQVSVFFTLFNNK